MEIDRREFFKQAVFLVAGTTLLGVRFPAEAYVKNPVPFNRKTINVTAIEVRADWEKTSKQRLETPLAKIDYIAFKDTVPPLKVGNIFNMSTNPYPEKQYRITTITEET